ncbi:hypothetical protein HQQ81_06880 [Microbacteriaceae bacterium VKM Ac-2854]|nr:hypothetical protein [Microbacteriaceae bacterium VKM Ac-2854]
MTDESEQGPRSPAIGRRAVAGGIGAAGLSAAVAPAAWAAPGVRSITRAPAVAGSGTVSLPDLAAFAFVGRQELPASANGAGETIPASVSVTNVSGALLASGYRFFVEHSHAGVNYSVQPRRSAAGAERNGSPDPGLVGNASNGEYVDNAFTTAAALVAGETITLPLVATMLPFPSDAEPGEVTAGPITADGRLVLARADTEVRVGDRTAYDIDLTFRGSQETFPTDAGVQATVPAAAVVRNGPAYPPGTVGPVPADTLIWISALDGGFDLSRASGPDLPVGTSVSDLVYEYRLPSELEQGVEVVLPLVVRMNATQAAARPRSITVTAVSPEAEEDQPNNAVTASYETVQKEHAWYSASLGYVGSRDARSDIWTATEFPVALEIRNSSTEDVPLHPLLVGTRFSLSSGGSLDLAAATLDGVPAPELLLARYASFELTRALEPGAVISIPTLDTFDVNARTVSCAMLNGFYDQLDRRTASATRRYGLILG